MGPTVLPLVSTSGLYDPTPPPAVFYVVPSGLIQRKCARRHPLLLGSIGSRLVLPFLSYGARIYILMTTLKKPGSCSSQPHHSAS